MLNSMLSAILMYSRIPVPRPEWNEKNRRFSLCFFPLVGAVIGALVMGWRYICDVLETGDILYAAGAVGINVLITGGIHLDGFCDTCDARASWGDREKKLKILTDSHIGAFAAIKLGLYLILYTAVFTELRDVSAAAVVCVGYVLSRSLSGLAAVTFRAAKKEGSLHSFTAPADKKATAAVLVTVSVLAAAAMAVIAPAVGAAASVGALLTLLYYRHMAYKEFGGITGDLAGWFLQVCELVLAASAALTYRLMEVM